jgi:hypothetical protein
MTLKNTLRAFFLLFNIKNDVKSSFSARYRLPFFQLMLERKSLPRASKNHQRIRVSESFDKKKFKIIFAKPQ